MNATCIPNPYLICQTDIFVFLQNVKNEPEDLTGARRENCHQNNNNDPNSDGLQS